MEPSSDSQEPVLRYKATTPAVRLSPTPSADELAFDWTLSEPDKQLVLKHRGRENICRFAVQLCVLKKYGRFLTDYRQAPPAVLGYLCKQLEIKPLVALTGRARGNTESGYQREIIRYLGWQPYDDHAARRLTDWVAEHLFRQYHADTLVEQAENLLREHRIVIPGPAVFERAVNTAYRQAEGLVFQRITAQLPVAMRDAIDRLLTVDDLSGKSSFMRFADYPPEARAKAIISVLQYYQELARLGIETVHFTGISRTLVQRLAAAVRTYDVWQIRRFDTDKRYALAACFLYETKKTLVDYLVMMHAQFMTAMERQARHAWEKEHHQLRRQVTHGIASLCALAATVLSLQAMPEAPLRQLFEQIDPVGIQAAIANCEAFEHLQTRGYVDQLRVRYSNFRRYFPHFIQLEFQAEPSGQRLLKAIDVLRQLDTGELKALPAAVDTSFVPAGFRQRLTANSTGIDRRTWEIGLALAVRDALRAGELYLPESRRHVAFWNLCYDSITWLAQRPTAYRQLGLPVAADAVIDRLVSAFQQTAERTATDLPSNPFADVVNGQLRLKRDAAVAEPTDVPVLRQLIAHSLPHVRIERLLQDIDARCHFTSVFNPLGRQPSNPRQHYATLLAALVAHGTNLGIGAMADSAEGVTVDQLQELTRTCLREESIRAANAVLVNYLRRLPVSAYWGDGHQSSSDGQRFGVQRSSLVASFYPRYFGYYDRAVTIYTHVSDQFSVFSTQVISCAEREALYVLEGLLQHNTELDIQAHSTDTHGFTHPLFGLCALLGYTFMPRIKDLKHQQLYQPSGIPLPERLEPLFNGAADLAPIQEQWDDLVRVAASLKNGVAPAHVVVKRLLNATSGNRLAKAFTHLGRLLKTTYLLRFLNDPALRYQVGLQLSRSERRQDLARHVFFANQGEFRSGDYFEMMNKASCLSLLSNAILIYNAVHIGDVLAQAEAEGAIFSSETIAHITPLQHSHVIVNGAYDFSDTQPVPIES